MPQRGAQSGFTLIEIIIVVFILGMLAALVGPQLMGRAEWAKWQQARTQIEHLEQAVKVFKLDNGRLPTDAEGLQALVPPPPAHLPNYDPDGYLDGNTPKDPWKRPFVYETDGRRFTIVSYGADGTPGGEGYDADIDNWSS